VQIHVNTVLAAREIAEQFPNRAFRPGVA